VRITTYLLRRDGGFAPNPFHGWCTLACCKPAIRRKAQPGDWIMGITPRSSGNQVAYAMQVGETLSFDDYWADPRFRKKRPKWDPDHDRVASCGDNCYRPTGDGEFEQLRSAHWNHEEDRESEGAKRRDLSGRQVLVARRFCYFGGDAIDLPEELAFAIPARFHRVNFTEGQRAALLRFVERLPQGVHGRPRKWEEQAAETRLRPRCG
jgi:hypothetical protein